MVPVRASRLGLPLLFSLGGLLFLLGVLLPLLLTGQWYLLWARVLDLEPKPLNPSLFLSSLAQILPQNLAIVMVAAYGIPILLEYFPRAPRSLPALYGVAQCFTLGLLASPAGIAFGPGYLLVVLPLALGEGIAYILAGAYGQSRALGQEASAGWLFAALFLLLASGVYEAWTNAVYWR